MKICIQTWGASEVVGGIFYFWRIKHRLGWHPHTLLSFPFIPCITHRVQWQRVGHLSVKKTLLRCSDFFTDVWRTSNVIMQHQIILSTTILTPCPMRLPLAIFPLPRNSLAPASDTYCRASPVTNTTSRISGQCMEESSLTPCMISSVTSVPIASCRWYSGHHLARKICGAIHTQARADMCTGKYAGGKATEISAPISGRGMPVFVFVHTCKCVIREINLLGFIQPFLLLPARPSKTYTASVAGHCYGS